MEWLKTIAPTIATALGGPLAGAAVAFVADKLGLSEKTTEAVQAAIAGATPEQMVQLKAIDAELQKFFAGLGIKVEEIAAADRASARDMLKTTRSWVPAALSMIYTGGYFSVLIGMLYGELQVADSQALLILLGSLTAGQAVVLAFWFGTTADSGRKTEILARKP